MSGSAGQHSGPVNREECLPGLGCKQEADFRLWPSQTRKQQKLAQDVQETHLEGWALGIAICVEVESEVLFSIWSLCICLVCILSSDLATVEN